MSEELPEGGCQHTYRMERCGDKISHVVIVDSEPLFEGHEPALNGKLWVCEEHVEHMDDSKDDVTIEPVSTDKSMTSERDHTMIETNFDIVAVDGSILYRLSGAPVGVAGSDIPERVAEALDDEFDGNAHLEVRDDSINPDE